jgi:protein kinase C substrate 80K-H
LFLLACLVIAHANIQGVAPQDQNKYPKSTTFTCFDKSKVIPFERVNDDYCDCADGSDEPGTSACSGTGTTKFFCSNHGFYPKYLHASFVNDGVCDCCDGSDEYESTMKCKNTCLEDGAEIRRVLTDKIATLQHGITMKHGYSEQGVLKFNEKMEQLKPLLSKLEESTAIINGLETQKNTLEKVEDAERNLMKEKAEAEKKANEPVVADPPAEPQTESTESTDPLVDKPVETPTETVTEAAPVVEKDDFSSYKNQGKFNTNPHTLVIGFFENIRATLSHYYYSTLHTFYSYNFNKTEAETARLEYNSKKSDHDILKNTVEALQKEVALNFGKDKELYPLYDRCFSADHREYTYEACFYKNANQKSKSGSSTSLGNFESVDGTVMKFGGGQHCWNGPARTFTVSMKCGLSEQLTNIDEPSMCVYTADFQTPAACSEEELLKLKDDFAQVGGEL